MHPNFRAGTLVVCGFVGPDSAAVAAGIAEVWSTWGAVEASLARHGVEAP